MISAKWVYGPALSPEVYTETTAKFWTVMDEFKTQMTQGPRQ